MRETLRTDNQNEVGTMNRDESIALVNELCSEYMAVKELRKKSELDRQAVEKAEYNQKRVDELMRQRC